MATANQISTGSPTKERVGIVYTRRQHFWTTACRVHSLFQYCSRSEHGPKIASQYNFVIIESRCTDVQSHWTFYRISCIQKLRELILAAPETPLLVVCRSSSNDLLLGHAFATIREYPRGMSLVMRRLFFFFFALVVIKYRWMGHSACGPSLVTQGLHRNEFSANV
jgi:hypothetical protein